MEAAQRQFWGRCLIRLAPSEEQRKAYISAFDAERALKRQETQCLNEAMLAVREWSRYRFNFQCDDMLARSALKQLLAGTAIITPPTENPPAGWDDDPLDDKGGRLIVMKKPFNSLHRPYMEGYLTVERAIYALFPGDSDQDHADRQWSRRVLSQIKADRFTIWRMFNRRNLAAQFLLYEIGGVPWRKD